MSAVRFILHGRTGQGLYSGCMRALTGVGEKHHTTSAPGFGGKLGLIPALSEKNAIEFRAE